MFLCEEKPTLVCSLYKEMRSLQQTWIKLLDSWIVFLYNVFVNFLKLENLGCLDFQKTDSYDDIQNKRLRFILHIPSEERDNAIRVCFQIELAHWFYLDFCMQNSPGLPQCGIRDFAKADILKRCCYNILI
uniref:M7GpppN-mRNA hydrolase-like n=1 Tax=Sinocyclocheilus grahami TaxID=75366 RepID=A0A672KUQ7_SINGR